jgi:hypothetical protein
MSRVVKSISSLSAQAQMGTLLVAQLQSIHQDLNEVLSGKPSKSWPKTLSFGPGHPLEIRSLIKVCQDCWKAWRNITPTINLSKQSNSARLISVLLTSFCTQTQKNIVYRKPFLSQLKINSRNLHLGILEQKLQNASMQEQIDCLILYKLMRNEIWKGMWSKKRRWRTPRLSRKAAVLHQLKIVRRYTQTKRAADLRGATLTMLIRKL